MREIRYFEGVRNCKESLFVRTQADLEMILPETTPRNDLLNFY